MYGSTPEHAYKQHKEHADMTKIGPNPHAPTVRSQSDKQLARDSEEAQTEVQIDAATLEESHYLSGLRVTHLQDLEWWILRKPPRTYSFHGDPVEPELPGAWSWVRIQGAKAAHHKTLGITVVSDGKLGLIAYKDTPTEFGRVDVAIPDGPLKDQLIARCEPIEPTG